MRQGAVTQRKAPGAGNAFAGLFTAHNFGTDEEMLDLVFSKSGLSGLICGSGNKWADQTDHRPNHETSPMLVKYVHRSTSRRLCPQNLRPFARVLQP